MLALLIAAQVATAFNMDCKGLQREGTYSVFSTTEMTVQSQRVFASTFRVDLAGKKWCEDDCTTINSIAEITDGEIVLWSRFGAPPPRLVVNRVSGDLTFFNRAAGKQTVIAAQCERADFTGFPDRKF